MKKIKFGHHTHDFGAMRAFYLIPTIYILECEISNLQSGEKTYSYTFCFNWGIWNLWMEFE